MVTTLQRLGSETVLVLDPALLAQAGIAADATLTVEVRDGTLVLTPELTTECRVELDDAHARLAERFADTYRRLAATN